MHATLLSQAVILALVYAVYKLFIQPRFNSLAKLAGPPVRSLFVNHLKSVLDPAVSARVHEIYIKHYGRSIRIRGIGPWDDRLLTLDPVSVAHVLRHPEIYEKPWPSRQLISSLIGCGMLSAEGETYKRQRRVISPAFSPQNMRALVPLVFQKGIELRDRWAGLVDHAESSDKSIVLDVSHWFSRATFDVIGLAGFDYDFHAIHNESNELFQAYREMFEVVISQGALYRTLMIIWAPFLNKLFPDRVTRTLDKCQEVIGRVTGTLIQERKRKVVEADAKGMVFEGKDLLSLLLKANTSEDLPPQARLTDTDVLHNVNTVLFAGSDTMSLTLSWTLVLLARHQALQTRLRGELLSVLPKTDIRDLGEDEIQSLHAVIADLPYFHNVLRESLRLIPPLHSSLRVATRDDAVPTQYPIRKRDGSTETLGYVHVPKGSFVHVAVEGMNLDKEIWGEDAWEFDPNRWDNLPESAKQQPGLFSNILSFSAGPRSCIGMRFSLIEIKIFLFFMITNFVFKETDLKIIQANVVLTRPYISGKFKEGSQCPLVVSRYEPQS